MRKERRPLKRKVNLRMIWTARLFFWRGGGGVYGVKCIFIMFCGISCGYENVNSISKTIYGVTIFRLKAKVFLQVLHCAVCRWPLHVLSKLACICRRSFFRENVQLCREAMPTVYHLSPAQHNCGRHMCNKVMQNMPCGIRGN